VDIGECSTLDLAPTMLALLGLPVPEYMKGRVLDEALERDSPVLTEADFNRRQTVASGS
jgi:hypothetical protein